MADDNSPLIATYPGGERRMWDGSQWKDIGRIGPEMMQAQQYFQNLQQRGIRPSQTDVQQFQAAHQAPVNPTDVEAADWNPDPSIVGRMSEGLTGLLAGSPDPNLLTHPIRSIENAADYWRHHPAEMAWRDVNQVVNQLAAPVTTAYHLATSPIQTIGGLAAGTHIPEDIKSGNWGAVAGDIIGNSAAIFILNKGVPAAAMATERLMPMSVAQRVALRDFGGQPLRQSTGEALLAGGTQVKKMLTEIGNSVNPGRDRVIIDSDYLYDRIKNSVDDSEVNKLILNNPTQTSRLIQKLEPYAAQAGHSHMAKQMKSWTRTLDHLTATGKYIARDRDAYVSGGIAAAALGWKWVLGGATLGYTLPFIRRLRGLAELYSSPLRREGATLLRQAMTVGPQLNLPGGGGGGGQPPGQQPGQPPPGQPPGQPQTPQPPWWRPPQTPTPPGPPPGGQPTPAPPPPGQTPTPQPPWVNPAQTPTPPGPPPGGSPTPMPPPSGQTPPGQPPWAGFGGRPSQMGGPPGGSVLPRAAEGLSAAEQNIQNFMNNGMTFKDAQDALRNLGYKEKDIPKTPPAGRVPGRVPTPPITQAPPPWAGAGSEAGPSPIGPPPQRMFPRLGTTPGFGTAPEGRIPPQYQPGQWPWPPPQQRLLGPASDIPGPPPDPADGALIGAIHNILQQNQDPELAKSIVKDFNDAVKDAQESVKAAQSSPSEGAPVEPKPVPPKTFNLEQITAARNLLRKFYGSELADSMIDEVMAGRLDMNDIVNSSFLQGKKFSKELATLKQSLGIPTEAKTSPRPTSASAPPRTIKPPRPETTPPPPPKSDIDELMEFYRSRGITEKGVRMYIDAFEKDPRRLQGAIQSMREIKAKSGGE